MNKGTYIIRENRSITKDIYRMVLEGDTTAITAPGQFVNIALEGFYLRRPISICDWDNTTITLIYKVVGKGTRAMAAMASGQALDLLVGLGNGFSVDGSGDAPLLIGGGVGVPPMYGLAKTLLAKGITPMVILGFNTKDEVFYHDEFAALGAKVLVTTVDGTLGIQGFVTEAMKQCAASKLYTCGPEAMLRAIHQAATCPGEYSFEERMGCGFGACMGCSCETKYGYKRICKEGPVLEGDEILW